MKKPWERKEGLTIEDPSMLRFAGTSFGYLVWKRKRKKKMNE
jgi:hypothetical protein